MMRVFRTLIGFLAYLEPKPWHKKQKLAKMSTPTTANPGYITSRVLYMAITRQHIELETYSSPLQMGNVL